MLLQENAAYRLQSALKTKYSLKQETLFLQENYHVWKDAIQALMKLILPISSLVRQWFSAFFDEVEVTDCNRVIQNNALIKHI